MQGPTQMKMYAIAIKFRRLSTFKWHNLFKTFPELQYNGKDQINEACFRVCCLPVSMMARTTVCPRLVISSAPCCRPICCDPAANWSADHGRYQPTLTAALIKYFHSRPSSAHHHYTSSSWLAILIEFEQAAAGRITTFCVVSRQAGAGVCSV